jgi:ABC-2 type transport system ATP-binding protein
MPEFVLEITDLRKVFVDTGAWWLWFTRSRRRLEQVVAVDGVSIKVKPGQILVILGPNGAGKTTLLRLVGCLVSPTSGSVIVNGYDATKDECALKRSIGFSIGDERSFYARLSGRQNLSFFAALLGMTKEQTDSRIEELSLLLGLSHLYRAFQTYPSGIKQRFAIARALLSDPPLLLMDEPTKNLDPVAAHDILNFIKTDLVAKQGKSVLIATHHLGEASLLGGRIAIMNKGKIAACADKEKLLQMLSGGSAVSLEDVYHHYIHA